MPRVSGSKGWERNSSEQCLETHLRERLSRWSMITEHDAQQRALRLIVPLYDIEDFGSR